MPVDFNIAVSILETPFLTLIFAAWKMAAAILVAFSPYFALRWMLGGKPKQKEAVELQPVGKKRWFDAC